MDKFLGKYRIPSSRLQNWDYGWNAPYFVTICTANRNHYFGEIINGEMHFSEIGELANKYWQEIPEHFPFVILDSFQVMPNHIHGILIIDKTGDWQNENAEIKMNGSADGPMDRSADGLADGSADGLADGLADGSADGLADGSADGSADGLAAIETRQCLVSAEYPGYFNHFDNSDHSNHPDRPEPTLTKLTPGQIRFQNQGKDTLSSILGSYKSVVTKYAHKLNHRFGWQSRFHDHIIRDDTSHQRIGNYIINNPKNWKEDKFFE